MCECCFWALLRKGDAWLGTQTQPWDCCSGNASLTIQTSYGTMNAKDGISQRLICYSLLHPPAGRAGAWDSAAGAGWEFSLSAAGQRRERAVGKAEECVGGFCVLSRAWSILRLLQAPLPLGARGWACASREAAEGIFWESWPELTIILENEAGRGGEGHRFFWSNLGVRHLYRVSWGPWAVHPWHVGVHVGPCCRPGESSRAPAGLPPPAGAQDSRKRERAWPSSVLWAFVWERGVGFRCLQMPGFVKTPDVFHVKCVRLSACVCVLLANTDFLMLLCDICCLGSVPNIKGSLPKYLFLFSV